MGDHSTTLGRVWREGRASGCYGWSWASPELRGQACYNLMPVATGRNLLFRQNVLQDVLVISTSPFPFCFHLMLSACPDSLFGLTELSTTGKELGGQGGSQASDHSPPAPTCCRRRPAKPGAICQGASGPHSPPITDVTLHLLLSRRPQEEAFFPWQRAINSERVCLCGQCHLPA